MKKFFALTLLLGMSAGVFAGNKITYPEKGVLCDSGAGYCVDKQGISMPLTGKHLSVVAQKKLKASLGDGTDVTLGEYTLSNGVHCDSKEQKCYRDRYYPRTENNTSRQIASHIFG